MCEEQEQDEVVLLVRDGTKLKGWNEGGRRSREA